MSNEATGLMDYLAATGVHLPEETVTISQWDNRSVILRGFSSKARDAFEEDSLKRAQAKTGNGARKRNEVTTADLSNFRARFVARHIIENGAFPFANAKGEELLGSQPATVLDKLFTVAQRLSGMSNEDVENLVGNVPPDSEEITEDVSSSSSLAH